MSRCAVALVLVLGLMAGCGREDPVRVMLVGDSVTQGSAGDWTWRYRLWEHLVDGDADVDFVGPSALLAGPPPAAVNDDYADPDFDRDHAARWGKSFDDADWPVDQLIDSYDPDVVVELLGVNDAIWRGADVATLLADARHFVAMARSADPDVDIVLGALPQTWNTAVAAYDEQLAGLAEELDRSDSRVVATAVPDDFVQNVDTYDPVHPSASGEVKIAAEVADALADLGIGAPYPRPLPSVAPVPTRPAELSATSGVGSVELTWEPPPGGQTAYVWVRDASAGEAWRRLPYGLSGTTWTDEGLIAGHSYEFRIQSAKGTSVSEVYSNVVMVTPD